MSVLKVDVFSNGALIGRAELRAEDPPMGVASGTLIAAEAYAIVRPVVDAILMHQRHQWSSLGLRVVADNGATVDGVGGVWIDDFLEADADWLPVIRIAGMDCSNGQYEAWFGDDPAYRSYYGK